MTLTRRALVPLVAALAACNGQPYTPPVFNAVDPSVQCEAGLVGWDFSTGGAFGEDIRNSKLSNELQIVEASFGFNPECNLSYGNWTENFAAECNGRIACQRKVRDGEADPKPGCNKAFQVKYRCGSEPAVYQLNRATAAATDSEVVALQCTDKIFIKRASYGRNCNPALKDNFTTQMADACNGLRKCQLTKPSISIYGSDPAVTCYKLSEVTFTCGGDPTERMATWIDPQIGTFTCPPPQLAPPGSVDVLRIISATFGRNCNAPVNNVKSWVEGSCNGKRSCIGPVSNFDPCVGVKKSWEAQYSCGSSGTVYTKVIPANFEPLQFQLQCGDPIHIKEASYGKNCNAANLNNLLSTVGSTCNDKRYCGPGTAAGLIADPAPGCTKLANFTWTCGEDSSPGSAAFFGNDPIQFECGTGRQVPSPSSGIRILEASFGKNCAAAAANNRFAQATASCFGKDVCDFTAPLAPDPAPNCPKELLVDYRCGDETEVQHALVAATQEGTPVHLTCGPLIRVLSATYGRNVDAGFLGNVTSDVKGECEGRRGRCTYAASNLIDPAFGLTKDLDISFACWPNPRPYSASIPRPADGKSVTFECATPTTPWVDKACVPEQCYGNERRDARLQCVADNVLPDLGVITKTLFKVKDPTLQAPHLFSESAPWELSLEFEHPAAGPGQFSADAGAEVPTSPATVWVSDTFTHLVGTPFATGSNGLSAFTVDGFRCLIGSMALKVGDPTHYVATSKNLLISPNCFGSRISSWRDAARSVGWKEADFRRSYAMDPNHHDVHVSFDPEGRARVQRGYSSSDRVPNPIGFFYVPELLWADLLSYYRQSEVTATTNALTAKMTGWAFNESTALQVRAESAIVRRTSVKMPDPRVVVPLFDPQADLSFDVDFRWAMLGDSPGRNPFSPTDQPLSAAVKTLAERHLGATVEVALESAVDGRPQATPWVVVAETEVLNRSLSQGDFQLGGGLATGKTDRLHVVFTNAMRTRVMRPWNQVTGAGNNYGWNGTPGHEAETTFLRLRVCLSADGLAARPYPGSPPENTLSASRGTTTYTLGMAPSRQCVISNERLLIFRDNRLHTSPPAHTSQQSSAGQSSDQGDSNVSTANDNGSQTGCSTAAGSTNCASTDSSTFVSAGTGGRSLYASTTTSQGGPGPAATSYAGAATVQARTEVLGFSVLNSDSDNPQAPKALALGWQSFESVSPRPQWGNIIKRLKQAFGAKPPTPVELTAKEWNRRANRQGLTIGLNFRMPVASPPMTVDIGFGVSVGIGMPIDFRMRMVTAKPTSAESEDYPCIDQTLSPRSCLVLSTMTLTQEEARTLCRVRGGRLAELDTSAKVATAQLRVNSANEEFWIGGQTSYAFRDPNCSLPGANLISCGNNSYTFFEWADAQTTFGAMNNHETKLLTNASYVPNWGGTQDQLSELRTPVPDLAQVAFRGSNRHLTAYPQGQKKQLRYLCEYEPAAFAFGYKTTSSAGLDVALGFDFSLCIPTPDIGVCITAGLDLISMGINYEHKVTHWALYDGLLTRIGSRSNVSDKVTFDARFLSGTIAAELRLLYISLRWEIVRFNGIQAVLAPGLFEQILYKADYPSRSDP